MSGPTPEEINKIVKTHFGLDLEDHIVHMEIVQRLVDPERYDTHRAEFEARLANHPDEEAVRRRSYYGDVFAIHLQHWFPREEIKGLHPNFSFHYPICTVDEILRIQSPKTAEDHLLVMRANAIADNPRLTRVFMKRRERKLRDWSLTSHFSTGAFERYLKSLPENLQKRCRGTPAGMGFLREPNGLCVRSLDGDFILISESLEPYLYYMNAFLLTQNVVDFEDVKAALMIALRTMFLTESPDFDLDPRGRFPKPIDRAISKFVQDQMQFIVGHEYSHLLLNHLDSAAVQSPQIGVVPNISVNQTIRYYTPRQNQEFEADAGALLQVVITDARLGKRLDAAIWFFLGLEILYAVSDYINPSQHAPNSHPPPIERIWALRRAVEDARGKAALGQYTDGELVESISGVESLKQTLLKEFVPYQVDALETYGSVYLPSFPRAMLVDRVDF